MLKNINLHKLLYFYNKSVSMIKKLLFATLFFCVFSLSHAQTVYEGYQDGIIIFQVKTNVEYNIPVRSNSVDINRVNFIKNLKEQYGIYEMIQMHPNDPDELLRHTYQIKFDMWSKVDDLVASIKRESIIEYAEKKVLHHYDLIPNDLGPNNANIYGAWHLHKINAQQAWDLCTGSPNVVVAVTDNAFVLTHHDLQNKFVQGYDASSGGSDPSPCGINTGDHGTAVSGSVGAETDNNIGISSIGYDVSIMPIKIAVCGISGNMTHGFEGVNYAANNGADVINMSWGGGLYSAWGQNVCNAAANAGAILVASAGNNSTDSHKYPASYTNVISVASTTIYDTKSGFSNYGTAVDIAAPGSWIFTTYSNSDSSYSSQSGTSVSSPIVAGLLGLMKSYAPSASSQEIINCLLSSADNIDHVNGNYIGQLGAGRINAFAALQCIGAFNLTLDAGIVEIIAPGTMVCGNSFTPELVLRNFGVDTLSNVTINYEWNGTPNVYNWTGNLAPGQTDSIILPLHTVTSGNYTFTASTSNPNGGQDLNLTNDQVSDSFIVDTNGQMMNLDLTLDCFGAETSWSIEDDNGLSLYTGGNYSNNSNVQTITESFCLPVGCYTFFINDQFGDGMNANGCSFNGDYSISDENGNILVQMSALNADFGFGTSDDFCVFSPNIQNDAGISSIISPSRMSCSNAIIPEVKIRNFGYNPLTSATINYQTNAGVLTFAWTGNLLTGQEDTVILPSITTAGGSVTFIAYTSNPNGQLDDDVSNDQNTSEINVYLSALPLPYTEDFESGDFNSGQWLIDNPDNDISWQVTTVGGISPGANAAKIDFYNYTIPEQRDGLTTPLISLVGYNSAQLDFDHAYRNISQIVADSLIVYVSPNCGQTWNVELATAEDGTGSFMTQTTNTTAPFTPSIADDWCFSGGVGASCLSVNLDAYLGQEIFVKFESYSEGSYGNNLFIDNINIHGVHDSLLPTPNFTTNSSLICEGDSVLFNGLSSENITGWNWSFPGGVPSTSTLQNPIVYYATSGNYDVILTVSNNFGTQTLTSTGAIAVHSIPTVNIMTAPLSICIGDSVQITASGGANSYTWNNGLGIGISKTVSPSQTTVYTVIGTDTNSCSSTASITVTVEDEPLVSVNAASLEICNGQTIALIVTGAINYTWTPTAGLSAGSDDTLNANPTSTTFYTVEGSNNCGTDTETFTITVNPVPVSPVITQNGNNLSVTLQSGETATWTYNGVNAGSGGTITMIGNGTYGVTVTNSFSCQANASENFDLDATSTQELDLNHSLSVYPNPSDGLFTIEFDAKSTVKLWIIDGLGKRITKTLYYKEGIHLDVINLSEAPAGVYTLMFDSEDGLYSKQLIKK